MEGAGEGESEFGHSGCPRLGCSSHWQVEPLIWCDFIDPKALALCSLAEDISSFTWVAQSFFGLCFGSRVRSFAQIQMRSLVVQ